MASLTLKQGLFVLRAVGKAWLLENGLVTGQGLPGETFPESFREVIDNPVGRLASRLAIIYQLDYDTAGNIMLMNPPTVDQVRTEVTAIGMRIPNNLRSRPEQAMTYLQNFGSAYKLFNGSSTGDLLNKDWLHTVSMGTQIAGSKLIDRPAMAGLDIYLNVYLETHLRDLYTDFDLFNLNPNLNSQVATLNNRNDIIQAIIGLYRPAGIFYVSFGFRSITIQHNYNNQTTTYNDMANVRRMLQDGRLIVNGIELPHIGLYQLAFLLKPEYINMVYGVEISDLVRTATTGLYNYFLQQIKLTELSERQAYRFTERFVDFNQDLNKGFYP